MKAIIVSIGDELLIGQTINTNAAWLGQKLGEVGVAIAKVITVGDEDGAIRSAIAVGLQEAEITLATGGLGPTHDDITKKSVAAIFGSEMVFHEEILQSLRERFRTRGYEMPAINENQAWLPAKAKILPNDVGSAQGMLFERDQRFCVVMPGVPHEMKFIMEHSVLPMLRQINTEQVILHHTWRTTGVPESVLFEQLGDIDAIEKFGKLAFLPKFTGVDLRLSVVAKTSQAARERVQAAEEIVIDKVGKFVYATGDTALEQVVGDLLQARGRTISVAESCTGGLLSERFTNIPGSSQYFMGGVVAYSNQQKMAFLGVPEETLVAHGAVSEQTAIAMATGVREKTGTSYGLSITGIAGPGGGTPEKPVGLVYIGLATSDAAKAKKFIFGEDRLLNRERSAQAALQMLFAELKGAV